MTVATEASRPRFEAVDLTKGWLVVLMVLYHSLNQSTQYELGFRYLAFLPPSFILITGLMLTKVYVGRYRADSFYTDTRLLLRGFKLISLFVALNVMLRLALPSARGGGVLRGRGWDEIVSVFVLGGGYGVAFDVLLPIAYVLLLAPVILRLNALGSAALPTVTLATVCAVIWLEAGGHSYPNLSLASVGVVGALLGRFPTADDVPRGTAAVLALISGVVCVVTTRRAPVATMTYAVQSAAAISAVATLSFGSRAIRLPHLVREPLTLLGRYSLLAYIIQIGVLFVLATVWGRPLPGSVEFVALFAATLLFTLAAAGAAEWLRPRSPWFDGAYRVVFA